jgi:hypothetical protein
MEVHANSIWFISEYDFNKVLIYSVKIYVKK